MFAFESKIDFSTFYLTQCSKFSEMLKISNIRLLVAVERHLISKSSTVSRLIIDEGLKLPLKHVILLF